MQHGIACRMHLVDDWHLLAHDARFGSLIRTRESTSQCSRACIAGVSSQFTAALSPPPNGARPCWSTSRTRNGDHNLGTQVDI